MIEFVQAKANQNIYPLPYPTLSTSPPQHCRSFIGSGMRRKLNRIDEPNLLEDVWVVEEEEEV